MIQVLFTAARSSRILGNGRAVARKRNEAITAELKIVTFDGATHRFARDEHSFKEVWFYGTEFLAGHLADRRKWRAS